MARDTPPNDIETSFLDVSLPAQRRSWHRRPQSASVVMPDRASSRGNRLRKKGSWGGRGEVGRRASEGEGDDGSVDSRTSAVVVDVAGASPGASVPLGTRMSNWWSSLVADAPREESRWARRHAEAGRGLLAAARQRAVGGVRYLLDGEAQPESREDVWVRGVVHRFEGEAVEWPDSCESRGARRDLR